MGGYTKGVVSSAKFLRHAVAFLNELVSMDPSVGERLVPRTAPETDPSSLPVVRVENLTNLSVVGIINTILQRAGSSDFIGHVEDVDGCVLGFQSVGAEAVGSWSS